MEVNSAKYVIVDHTPLQPPEISSTTHPKSDRWYSSDSPEMDLVTIPESQSDREYSFVLDHRPKNIPDNFPDLIVKNNKLKFSGLSDGIWWVHVRAKDQLGYWTETSHFEFRIKATATGLTNVTASGSPVKTGGTVTVTAVGKTGSMATFSVGTVVTDKKMTESTTEAGTYTGKFTVEAVMQAD